MKIVHFFNESEKNIHRICIIFSKAPAAIQNKLIFIGVTAGKQIGSFLYKPTK